MLIERKLDRVVKKILVTDRDVFEEEYNFFYIEEYLYEKIAPDKYQEWQEKLKKDNYEEETVDRYNLWVNSILDTEEFRNWEPDDDVISYILSLDGLERHLSTLWAKRNDPLRLGFMYIKEKFIGYLYIPATQHFASDGELGFQLGEVDGGTWDRQLRHKCKEYGIEMERDPTFYILRDNSGR